MWRVHVYRMEGHLADAAGDVERYEALRAADDVPRVPSGELVVPVIEAVVTGRARRLPVNVPNAGNVGTVPDGAVVEVMATVDSAGVRSTDRTVVAGVMGEWLRRVNASQELTVDASLEGDRDLVYQAMLLDPLCAHLSYGEVLAMTDDLLQATAPWLPQRLSGV